MDNKVSVLSMFLSQDDSLRISTPTPLLPPFHHCIGIYCIVLHCHYCMYGYYLIVLCKLSCIFRTNKLSLLLCLLNLTLWKTLLLCLLWKLLWLTCLLWKIIISLSQYYNRIIACLLCQQMRAEMRAKIITLNLRWIKWNTNWNLDTDRPITSHM